MSTCYRCGRTIPSADPHLRRKVITGQYERRSYPGRKVMSAQTTYGMRIVCRSCAHVIDRADFRRGLLSHAELLIAIAILVAILIYRAFGS